MNEPSPSTSDPRDRRAGAAISVERVSVEYRVRRGTLAGGTARPGVARLVTRRGERRIVPALRDVSIVVPEGEVLGVVGRNGAGKSTLVRVMAGIIPPAAGRVVVRGQVSALLSANFGFNRDLSGRDNLELGALAMGFSPYRIATLAESIIEFAELGEYVDVPMRHYSSGMRTRLGFALAAHLDPEILVIDEALAGGDARFRERVQEKMHELCRSGRTIVLVSHSVATLRAVASSCVWLRQGQVVEHGDASDVLEHFQEGEDLLGTAATEPVSRRRPPRR